MHKLIITCVAYLNLTHLSLDYVKSSFSLFDLKINHEKCDKLVVWDKIISTNYMDPCFQIVGFLKIKIH